MPSIALNVNTSIEALQAFAKTAGSKEIRAKTENGVTTLYTHSSWKPSLNRDPIERSTKQRAGWDAVTNFINVKFVNSHDVLTALSGANGGGALKGSGLSKVADKMKASTFEGTMSMPSMREAFKAFAAQEHAANNFNFIDREDRFQAMLKTTDPNNPAQMHAVRQEAMSIIDECIRESTGHFMERGHTDLQVNLPAAMQTSLESNDMASLHGMDKDDLGKLFGGARETTEKLLRRDTFHRFLMSEKFTEALEALR